MKMRKSNTLLAPVLLAFALLTSGCAAGFGGGAAPVYGGLYSEIQSPHPATTVDVTNSPVEDWSRTGEATAESYLGLVAIGDASLQAAMEDGNITEVHHVDVERTNILGLYATYTLIVYGE